MRRYRKDENGSVMLEFCLVLPIYLLLFGGTFLMFDITMGRLHLQEANRNLTWLQNDRYDSESKINQELYKRAVDYFESRNRLEFESAISDEPMWWAEKSDAAEYIAGKKSPKWAHQLSIFKDSDSGMKINYSLAGDIISKIPLIGDKLNETVFNNEFLEMYSGNMPLEMSRVSGVYRGAVGVSSVLFPVEEVSDLYNQAYTLTRAQVVVGNKDNIKCACCGAEYHGSTGDFTDSVIYDRESRKCIRKEIRPATVNNEMLLLRRKGDPNIKGEITLLLLGGYGKVMNAIWRNWPVGDSIVDDVKVLFGVK